MCRGHRQGAWQTLGVADGLAHNSVRSMLKDGSGWLWFGTRGGRVSRYDGETVTTFTTKDGLAENEVLPMVADEIGHRMEMHRRLIALDPIIMCAQSVPAIRVARTPQRTWHSDHDILDDVGPQAMRAGIHLYAGAAYRLVNAEMLPFERRVSGEDRTRAQERVDRWVPRTIVEARESIVIGKVS